MQTNQGAASIYIVRFYNDLEELNSYLGHYNNITLDLRTKYGGIPEEKLAEAVDDYDKQKLRETITQARFWCIKVFTKLSAIQSKFKTQNQVFAENYTKIHEQYKEITSKPVPRFELIQDYVIELNKIFVSGIGMELLIKSQEYYEQLTQSNVYTGIGVEGIEQNTE
jgi:hypothetical protein